MNFFVAVLQPPPRRGDLLIAARFQPLAPKAVRTDRSLDLCACRADVNERVFSRLQLLFEDCVGASNRFSERVNHGRLGCAGKPAWPLRAFAVAISERGLAVEGL